ncbi:hypothetical protein BHYA_0011g00230 [Botrytis hyacinthi]|uniref:Uncharacterized protein n=1 Tax=Botrytis hyacinthi TaxID=278943 RepID=A0A4Z1H1S5_9HELO|nr:hypothetical protein BHYA_0011g00230 [Botrytis hyacinthi]
MWRRERFNVAVAVVVGDDVQRETVVERKVDRGLKKDPSRKRAERGGRGQMARNMEEVCYLEMTVFLGNEVI